MLKTKELLKLTNYMTLILRTVNESIKISGAEDILRNKIVKRSFSM